MFALNYLIVFANDFFLTNKFVKYEKNLVFLFSCIGNVSYANHTSPKKITVTSVDYLTNLSRNEMSNYFFECIGNFHMPCPDGSSGQGYYFRQYLDCSTGEVIGTATSGSGCVDDQEQDLPVDP